MKATIDIPDEIYRRVKAKSAMEGRAVREVTIDLYRTWLAEPAPVSGAVGVGRLDAWFREADRAMAAKPGLRDVLDEVRNRLERRSRARGAV